MKSAKWYLGASLSGWVVAMPRFDPHKGPKIAAFWLFFGFPSLLPDEIPLTCNHARSFSGPIIGQAPGRRMIPHDRTHCHFVVRRLLLPGVLRDFPVCHRVSGQLWGSKSY